MSDSPTAPTYFFAVSTKKLVIMTLCTGGLYYIYWGFKNWSTIKKINDANIWPEARGFFLIFTCAALFREIYARAKAKGLAEQVSVGSLAAMFIVTEILGNFSARLDNQVGAILWFVSFASLYPTIQVQKIITFYNRRMDSNWQPLSTY